MLRPTLRLLAALAALAALTALTAAASAQPPTPQAPAHVTSPDGLPPGPTWGRGNFKPTAANVMFATGDGCSLCHSASPKAGALWSPTGEDVSPYELWRSTLMAHAAKDPYWKAQVAGEVARHPQQAAEIEGLCLRCHAPTAHHSRLAAGRPAPRMAEIVADPLAADGVNCTVCHQIRPDGLGTPDRFNGNVLINPGRTIFGPYADPGGQPMIMHSAFTPTQGEHIRSATLCAGCHTLHTGHTGERFPEQTPYLEWLSSAYSDAPSSSASTRSCQECHMPEVGPMRVARNPAGLDFNIKTRSPVRGHVFVGGNAFMLDLLATNAQALGVTAPADSLARTARASRAQLSHRTVTVAVENLHREHAEPGTPEALAFDVVVTNLTGHKFPTGYPSRRAWVSVEVRDARTTIFASGEPDDAGRIKGVPDELAIPHADLITSPAQVAVYELIAADAAGKPTTRLSEMARRVKDTRLLPAGFAPSPQHAPDIAPVGLAGDANFAPGQDRVTYRVSLPKDAGKRLTVVARVLYQTIPPAWADSLRKDATPEAALFLPMYDAAPHAPEQVAVTVGFEQP